MAQIIPSDVEKPDVVVVQFRYFYRTIRVGDELFDRTRRHQEVQVTVLRLDRNGARARIKRTSVTRYGELDTLTLAERFEPLNGWVGSGRQVKR